MKKLIFFALFICFASFVNGQTKSLGLNTSYSFPNSDDYWITYESPQVGLVYNHFFNGKHGIVTELGVHVLKYEWITLPMSPALVPVKNYNFNYSLHYILKHNQFFIKSGLNAQAFNLLTVSGGVTDIPEYLKESECPIIFYKKSVSIARKEDIQVIPEFHFALGRDFDLGKINLRLNGFVERAFIVDNYIDVGVAAGVFYELGK